jgi:hypothetical protein
MLFVHFRDFTHANVIYSQSIRSAVPQWSAINQQVNEISQAQSQSLHQRNSGSHRASYGV